ncbi:MAG: hypothetical protein IJW86_08700 [Clostridia bacterium]|nr:hypothetical protein [Clostridia bacterium]
MKRETLIEMLRRDNSELTADEAIEILDKELEKAPEDADADLIDLCLQVIRQEAGDIPVPEVPDIDTLNRKMAEMLEDAESENQTSQKEAVKKHKKIKIGRIFALVAVVAVLAAVITTVSADYFNIDASESIVRFVKDRFITNLSDDDSVDLLLAFEEHGLENIVLPEVFYNQDLYKITEFECSGTNTKDTYVRFSFCSLVQELSGGAMIFSYEDDTSFLTGKFSVHDNEYNIAKDFVFNGVETIVFYSLDNLSGLISYSINDIEYSIELSNCSYDDILSIAKTINGVTL